MSNTTVSNNEIVFLVQILITHYSIVQGSKSSLILILHYIYHCFEKINLYPLRSIRNKNDYYNFWGKLVSTN